MYLKFYITRDVITPVPPKLLLPVLLELFWSALMSLKWIIPWIAVSFMISNIHSCIVNPLYLLSSFYYIHLHFWLTIKKFIQLTKLLGLLTITTSLKLFCFKISYHTLIKVKCWNFFTLENDNLPPAPPHHLHMCICTYINVQAMSLVMSLQSKCI